MKFNADIDKENDHQKQNMDPLNRQGKLQYKQGK